MADKTDSDNKFLETKDHWCGYSLQQLSPAKFIKVVRNILNGKYKLLSTGKSQDGSGDSDPK